MNALSLLALVAACLVPQVFVHISVIRIRVTEEFKSADRPPKSPPSRRSASPRLPEITPMKFRAQSLPILSANADLAMSRMLLTRPSVSPTFIPPHGLQLPP
eukprot:gene474-1882_t